MGQFRTVVRVDSRHRASCTLCVQFCALFQAPWGTAQNPPLAVSPIVEFAGSWRAKGCAIRPVGTGTLVPARNFATAGFQPTRHRSGTKRASRRRPRSADSRAAAKLAAHPNSSPDLRIVGLWQV
jgi:hypothetical protein